MQTIDLALLSNILPAEAFQRMSALGALSDEFVEQVLAAGELLELTEGEQPTIKENTQIASISS